MAKVTLSLNIESDTSAISRSINDFTSSRTMRNLIPFIGAGLADVLRAHGFHVAGLDGLARDQEDDADADPDGSTPADAAADGVTPSDAGST